MKHNIIYEMNENCLLNDLDKTKYTKVIPYFDSTHNSFIHNKIYEKIIFNLHSFNFFSFTKFM